MPFVRTATRSFSSIPTRPPSKTTPKWPTLSTSNRCCRPPSPRFWKRSARVRFWPAWVDKPPSTSPASFPTTAPWNVLAWSSSVQTWTPSTKRKTVSCSTKSANRSTSPSAKPWLAIPSTRSLRPPNSSAVGPSSSDPLSRWAVWAVVRLETWANWLKFLNSGCVIHASRRCSLRNPFWAGRNSNTK